MRFYALAAFLAATALAPAAFAQPAPAPEPVDTAAVSFIRTEAITRGRVMDHALWMTDVIGARLTGGPSSTPRSGGRRASSSSGASRPRWSPGARSGAAGRSSASR